MRGKGGEFVMNDCQSTYLTKLKNKSLIYNQYLKMLKMLCLFSAKNINNYLSQPNVKFGLINLDLIFLK
jgi:hypothetical protein